MTLRKSLLHFLCVRTTEFGPKETSSIFVRCSVLYCPLFSILTSKYFLDLPSTPPEKLKNYYAQVEGKYKNVCIFNALCTAVETTQCFRINHSTRVLFFTVVSPHCSKKFPSKMENSCSSRNLLFQFFFSMESYTWPSCFFSRLPSRK